MKGGSISLILCKIWSRKQILVCDNITKLFSCRPQSKILISKELWEQGVIVAKKGLLFFNIFSLKYNPVTGNYCSH